MKRDLVVFRAMEVNHSSSYPGTDSAFGPDPCGQRGVTILWEALQVSGSEEDRLKKNMSKVTMKIRCSQWKCQ